MGMLFNKESGPLQVRFGIPVRCPLFLDLCPALTIILILSWRMKNVVHENDTQERILKKVT